ncbi:hypothetical protein KIPB_008323, partial [Kipferlia bialata]
HLIPPDLSVRDLGLFYAEIVAVRENCALKSKREGERERERERESFAAFDYHRETALLEEHERTLQLHKFSGNPKDIATDMPLHSAVCIRLRDNMASLKTMLEGDRNLLEKGALKSLWESVCRDHVDMRRINLRPVFTLRSLRALVGMLDGLAQCQPVWVPHESGVYSVEDRMKLYQAEAYNDNVRRVYRAAAPLLETVDTLRSLVERLEVYVNELPSINESKCWALEETAERVLSGMTRKTKKVRVVK